MISHADPEIIEREGFEFSIVTEPDPYHSISEFLGTYTDNPKSGEYAIDRKYFTDIFDSTEYRYFVPVISLEDHREGLCKLGYSKHQAHEIAKSYVLHDYALAEEYSEGSRGEVSMTVVVTYDGVDLGDASVGWLDSDNSDQNESYKLDLMIEALSEAIDHLVHLGSSEVVAKAKKLLKALEQEQANAERLDRYVSLMHWRNLSEEYQHNVHPTRHALKHTTTLKALYQYKHWSY